MNQKKGMIRGICISPRRGTAKYPVETAKIVPDWGIEEDAHGGKWHRQISLLALEKIEAFREKGADVDFGAFGENLIVEGFDLRNVPVDSEIRIGDAVRLKSHRLERNATATVRSISGWETVLCQEKAFSQKY